MPRKTGRRRKIAESGGADSPNFGGVTLNHLPNTIMATDTDLSRLKDYVNSESTEINNLDTVHKPLTAAPLKVTPPLSWRHKIRRRLHPYASLISVLGIAIPLGIFLIKD